MIVKPALAEMGCGTSVSAKPIAVESSPRAAVTSAPLDRSGTYNRVKKSLASASTEIELAAIKVQSVFRIYCVCAEPLTTNLVVFDLFIDSIDVGVQTF